MSQNSGCQIPFSVMKLDLELIRLVTLQFVGFDLPDDPGLKSCELLYRIHPFLLDSFLTILSIVDQDELNTLAISALECFLVRYISLRDKISSEDNFAFPFLSPFVPGKFPLSLEIISNVLFLCVPIHRCSGFTQILLSQRWRTSFDFGMWPQ